MSVQKRKRELLKLAHTICPSATVEHTGGSHLVIIINGPQGSRKVFCACTASDHRDAKNVKRDLMGAARAVGLIAQNRNDPPVSQR
ncbi:hypothetical protein IB265_33010 [Ensifer sp. ENS10]|uniref:hypothetical protein n=1 Tax=Ensifer sp. ENS10 TaxID=2769286 RepID=UPI00177D1393|nr:hypothetical protein [Ensifer sp. ENS10]MBD9511578.1 hypothetical protein [Ensifer sp. ENS10]